MADEKAENKPAKESPKKELPKVEKEAPRTEAKGGGKPVEERIITVNLRKRLIDRPSWRRTNDAVAILRGIIEKKVKTEIVMDKRLNEKMWSRGIKNPQTKWRVKIVKDGEVTRAEPME